ncbi:hypothetical protein LPJ73_009185, partial [Coemansia sp. RSA 2703]
CDERCGAWGRRGAAAAAAAAAGSAHADAGYRRGRAADDPGGEWRQLAGRGRRRVGPHCAKELGGAGGRAAALARDAAAGRRRVERRGRRVLQGHGRRAAGRARAVPAAQELVGQAQPL